MTNIGSLSIVSSDRARAREVAAYFEHARYRVALHGGDGDALPAMRADPPDVVLMMPPPGVHDWVETIIDGLREAPETAKIGIAVAMADGELAHQASNLSRVDDILPSEIDADAMVFRLQPLFRLATMERETRLRAEGTGASPLVRAAPRGGARALYFSINPDTTLPADFLGHDAVWESANSITEAEAVVTGPGMFDIIVIDVSLDRLDEIVGFCRDMRDNPRLFNLPFLVRVPGADQGTARALYRVGVNRVIARADDEAFLEAEARSLIALQNRRNDVREALRRTLTDATGHPRQAVYTESFLTAYLDRRIALAQASDRALSVVHLHLPEAASLLEEAGATACQVLSEQLARWLSRLIRVEDLAARLTDSDFIVVLPDTLPSEAQFVMNRIAGVLTFTDFAVPEVYRPVKIWPLVGVAGIEVGDHAPSILNRARANLS